MQTENKREAQRVHEGHRLDLKRSEVLYEGNVTCTVSMGADGGAQKASSTEVKYHEGTLDLITGFNLRTSFKKRTAR